MASLIKARIQRNRRLSQRGLARDLQVSDRSVRRVVKEKLQCYPYRHVKCQSLSDLQKQKRCALAKELLQRFAEGRHRVTVFTDDSDGEMAGEQS